MYWQNSPGFLCLTTLRCFSDVSKRCRSWVDSDSLLKNVRFLTFLLVCTFIFTHSLKKPPLQSFASSCLFRVCGMGFVPWYKIGEMNILSPEERERMRVSVYNRKLCGVFGCSDGGTGQPFSQGWFLGLIKCVGKLFIYWCVTVLGIYCLKMHVSIYPISW